ncbi:hypothetical protein Cgig2_025333 [Carnegiea gigantea]|uniref:SWIM-type domain-containing protein n=1 Tax=Carnegiea gigantea TaxID=171969 RepID=A0A9Q1JS00_9CARY|nr:hypothetical protein Cgig2_025333 [Carnegiea gigantea]
MVLKEDMGLEEVRRKVSEITGIELTVQKLWYSLKYDQGMVVVLDGDGDVRMFMKGNDEHGYFYVGKSNGLKRCTLKATRTCEEGVVRVRSDRDGDDIIQQGGNGAGVKRAVVRGSGGCSDDHPQTRVRVGEELIKMSDDDEISVVSEDVGEDKAVVQGGEESSQGKGVMKGATLMRACAMKYEVGERIEQKLVDTYQKMGCITAVECYSLMLGEHSVELTNNRKLVVKLGQQSCTCRVWQTQGIPCCHTLAVMAKVNLCVYNYVHSIYKTATQQSIYNQLVHPMETHDMGTVDAKTGRVVGRDELDDDYDHCILPPTNGRLPEFLMFPVVRQPEMFTWEEANIDRGKAWSTTGKPEGADVDRGTPWSTSGTPLGNLHITDVELCHYAHTTFPAVIKPPPLFLYEANVHRSKPWCASGTPMENQQIEDVLLCLSDHTAFVAVSTPPPLFNEAYIYRGKPWSGSGTPMGN